MLTDPEKHRRSIRFAGYDYRKSGGYFVTMCAANKRCVFGKIHNDSMHKNVYGEIVAEEWERTATLRANVVLDKWVVMPNHFHGILMVAASEDNTDVPVASTFALPQKQTLSSIVGAFKSAVTRRINLYREERGLVKVAVWQRNFYERIIRDENELNNTRRYIDENPLNWPDDVENPNA